jgi:hypothetical protein
LWRRKSELSETISKYKAPALERGLDILELLSEQDEAISKKDMVAKLGRSVNELYRMLYHDRAGEWQISSHAQDVRVVEQISADAAAAECGRYGDGQAVGKDAAILSPVGAS